MGEFIWESEEQTLALQFFQWSMPLIASSIKKEIICDKYITRFCDTVKKVVKAKNIRKIFPLKHVLVDKMDLKAIIT